MRRLSILLGFTACCLLSPSTSAAATLVADDFESYTPNTALNNGNGGTGFTTAWSAIAAVTIQSPSLNPPIGQTSVQAVRLGGISGDVANAASFTFGPHSGAPLYAGVSVRAQSLDSGDFVNFLLSNGATGNTQQGLSFGLRNNPGNPFFARAGSSNDATTNSSQNGNNTGDFRLIAKFSPTGPNGEFRRVDLFINPLDFTEPLVADATAIDADPLITSLNTFSIRTIGLDGSSQVFFDNLIFATTFAEAAGQVQQIPEPATWTMWIVLAFVGTGYAARKLRRPSA